MGRTRLALLLLAGLFDAARMPGVCSQVTLPMRYHPNPDRLPRRAWTPRGSSAARDLPKVAQQTLQDKQAIFTVDIQVGGQTMALQVDTGSADMWVAERGCASCEKLLQPLYDPEKSGKASGPNGSHQVNYGEWHRPDMQVGPY